MEVLLSGLGALAIVYAVLCAVVSVGVACFIWKVWGSLFRGLAEMDRDAKKWM